jgi:P27 family predicted phage terminase small subunit
MGGRGSGGRNRKPTALKKIEGNRGKRALNKKEPVPPAIPPTVDPTTLTTGELSALEQKFWNKLFPIVSGMKLMTGADVIALEQLCRWLAEEQECTALITRMGRLIAKKDEQGKVIGVSANSVVRMRSDAAKHVRTYLAVFGLGPSFRSALAVENPDDSPQDPLENVRRAKTASNIVQ